LKKNKTFILGVGAQKAGTSWLHNYIQKSPVANMGPLKEYHFWNLYFVPDHKKRSFLKKKPAEMNSEEFLRYQMFTINYYYESFFCSLINDGFKITGDITPHYSKLQEEEFSFIKARLEKFGFHVKVIFLMRDPFERLWSNIRMERNLYTTIDNDLSDSEAIKLHFRSNRWMLDSMYHTQVFRIDSVFKKEDIYYGIFEEMFEEENIRKLSDFIGMKHVPGLGDQVVNQTIKSDEVNLSIKKEVCLAYKNVYRYCYERFPQTRNFWTFYQ